MKKILPPSLFLISIGTMLLLGFILPIRKVLFFPLTMIGLIPILLGLGLAILGSKKFDEVGANINTFDDPNAFLKDGLFKFSRNPMYLGFVISLFGLSVLIGNASTILVAIVFWIISDHWYIQFEEKAMKMKFGEEYEEYKRQTRRWL